MCIVTNSDSHKRLLDIHNQLRKGERTFEYVHLYFGDTYKPYLPGDMISHFGRQEGWFLIDFIWKLEVGEEVDTDFRRIKRVA